MAQEAKILAVDDEPQNLELLEALLTPHGYQVVTAADGSEALKKIAEERPDLILLDVNMPRLDGISLCRSLRNDPETRFIPVVMVTALHEAQDRIRGIEAGADDFLSKPVNRHELLARVQSILRLGYYRHLLAEKERFEQVVADLRDGIVVLNRHLEVTALNRAALHLLNIGPAAWQGLSLPEHLQGRFETPQPLETLIRTDWETFELVRPRADFPLHLSVRVSKSVSPDGELEAVALVIRDVTEERREERLQRDLFSLISHKLRTPLAVISGYLALFLKGTLGEVHPSQREVLQGMEKKTEELEGLVEKLLTFAAVAHGTEGGERQWISLPLLLEEVKERLLNRYPDSKVRIQVEMTEPPPKLQGDPRLLAMAWENLLDNAIKFCNKDGAQIRISGAFREDLYQFTLQDNGPGIPHEEMEHIFRPFYQVEEAFTGNVEGIGLGLPLVRRIIEAHGGKIWAESEMGKGTTVTFTLPASPAGSP
ncbi:MAG: response regulator [Candidatus Methylomirabilales bacterium]